MENLQQKSEGRDRDRIQGAALLQLQKPIFPLVHRPVSSEGEGAACPEVLGNLQPIFAYPVPSVVTREGRTRCRGDGCLLSISSACWFQLGK